MYHSLVVLLMLAGTLLASCPQNCDLSTFIAILESFPEASLNYVTQIPQNGSFGDAATNIPFPRNATRLPELCAASINVKTPNNTSYNFGIFLPTQWNGRFLCTGNQAFGGGINWIDMVIELPIAMSNSWRGHLLIFFQGGFSHYGFATISTDTGHSSAPDDGRWGLNQPHKLINWGYRAMHGSITTAKQVIQMYYCNDIQFSYYASCSTGGRQGFKEMQLHPETFDGVVVGAPAWWSTHLQSWALRQGIVNLSKKNSSHVPSLLFPAIVEEMVRQCDPQDGLEDGIIGDPFGCNFDFNQLLCQPGKNRTDCLTSAQIDTVHMLYSSFWDTNQTFVFPSITLGSDAATLSVKPSRLGSDFFRYWVYNNTNWDYTALRYEDIVKADEVDPGAATANNFDLSPFKQRGGKLIHYHGLADELIPAGSSQYFYDQVYRTLVPRGIKVDDFYRFFFVPGMSHCMGSTVAPWYIGGGAQYISGATHSVPGFMNSQHDVILAIMDWVENGKAPNEIIATKYWNDSVADGIYSQRPLCMYPKQARYVGNGDPNVPHSWKCA